MARKPPPRKAPPKHKPPRRQPPRKPNRPPIKGRPLPPRATPPPTQPPIPQTPPPSSEPPEPQRRHPGDAGDGTAPQIYNPGSRGQDARYDVRGLSRGPDGYLTDGRWRYDDNGLSLDRPSNFVSGLKPSDQMDDDQWGDYLAGGGGGGGGAGGANMAARGIIPGAGTYLENQALAQAAYERSEAGLLAQRRARQKAAGLGEDWKVDPLVMYGQYQQMLHGQGMELNEADEAAAARGLQGGGLGRQMESQLRYGHSVQNLGFKNQLAGWENEYQSGLAQLAWEREMAMLDALQEGANNAYGDWGGDDSGASEAPPGAPPGTNKKIGYRPPVRRNPYTGSRNRPLVASVPGGRRVPASRIAGLNRGAPPPRRQQRPRGRRY